MSSINDLDNLLNTLEPFRHPFEYPKGTKYILCEASGGAATLWRNKNLRSAKMIDGKVSGIDGIADSEPLLVANCVAKTDKDGNIIMRGNSPVFIDEALVRSWPAKLQKQLFDTIFEVSGLSETETEETLEKKITFFQERLNKIRETKKVKGEEDPSKNLQESMMDGSA